ncbi:FGGY-family carbohydrate kinase [Nocardia sp. NPDC052316]|uniref:FGGY-family carbohydrate kinase n=1 Tax=Nocardia sp. NPDC052316 TaxID=3364329 RepID=UPI0037CA6470
MSGASDLVVGIDVGTTAVKAALFTGHGTVLRRHTGGHAMVRPRPGWAEQEPQQWWLGCVRGVESVLEDIEPEAVRALGVVSQVNTHVFVDSDLRPLLPAITWQDQRCADIAREVDEKLTPADKMRIWGHESTVDASALVARALWVTRHEPEVWRRTRWVLSPKDYLNARLTGKVATDAHSSIGLVDAAARGYLTEAVDLVEGLAERLPPLTGPTVSLGQPVHPPFDRLLGSATVVVGTMDALGDAHGCGLATPRRAMVSCGTSLVVAGVSDRARPTPGVVTFPPIDGLHIHAGPTQAGGDALRWWSRTCGLTVAQVLVDAASARGGSGVVFTPHLSGERAPLWDAAVRGSFLGLSASTTRQDMSRAVLEGVAMSGRQVLAAVESACDAPLAPITLSGGGANSDLWAQIFADVLGRPLQRLTTRDYSAAFGAALLASVGAGAYPDLRTAAGEAVAVDRAFVPDRQQNEMLDPLYEIYVDSYHALREIHTKMVSWRSQRGY